MMIEKDIKVFQDAQAHYRTKKEEAAKANAAPKTAENDRRRARLGEEVAEAEKAKEVAQDAVKAAYLAALPPHGHVPEKKKRRPKKNTSF
jgi:uncharacterized membrane protein YgaE (UPF0421/DUF939 family)